MAKPTTTGGRRKAVILIAVLIFIIALIFAVINRTVSVSERLTGAVKRNAWPVDVQTLRPQEFVERVNASGVVEPSEEATLTAEVSARVVSIRADLGDTVRKGRTLVVLDSSNYRLAEKQAKAQLASAEAGNKLAQDNYVRAKKLAAQGHVTQAQLEEAETNANAAAASLMMARTAVQSARRNLGETVVRAPFAGRVSARLVSPGELVAPGTPVITVVKDATMRIDLALSEMEIKQVKPGMAAQVLVPALPDRTFDGEVTRVGVAADRASGGFPVQVEIDNADGELLAGMRATVSVVIDRVQGAVVVVRDQVVTVNGGDAVFVVNEDENGFFATAKPVTLGPRDGQRVLVLTGLQVGEQIVVVGHRSLVDGSRLEIVHRNGKRVEPPATPTPEAEE